MFLFWFRIIVIVLGLRKESTATILGERGATIWPRIAVTVLWIEGRDSRRVGKTVARVTAVCWVY